MTVIPIIVAYPIENESLIDIKAINSKCNLNQGIDFSKSIPHITLWMGFVKESELNNLSNEFGKEFKEVSIRSTVSGASLYAGISGSVLSLNVANDEGLALLQNKIHYFFEPFRVMNATYLLMNNVTVDYINSFFNKSLEQYEPHITIGFSEVLHPFKIREINFQEPKIFLAGNNCTCIEVID